MTLDFQEIAVAEQLLVPAGCPGRLGHVAVGDQTRHLRRRARRQDRQAAGVLLKQLFVDAGAVVETVDVGLGHQLHQVAVPGVVAGQQHQVVGAALRRRTVEPALVGYVNFAPDNGFDARFFASRVEIYHAVECSVIGDRQRVHSQFLGTFDQVGNTADAVEHAVFGVDVQVGEHRSPPLP